MQVDIQYTDRTRESVDHTEFYRTVKNKQVYRFSIGTADFYNHEFYSLEDNAGVVTVKMWDPSGVYPDGPHACVFVITSPRNWTRTQYGSGADVLTTLPYASFVEPTDRFKITGVGVTDTRNTELRTDWEIQKLPDYSRDQG